jgi:hypothetical protein
VSLTARVGYIVGVLMLGAAVGYVLSDKKKRPSESIPPVAELAEKLGEAWAPYHNR